MLMSQKDYAFVSTVESYVSVVCWINEEVIHNYVKWGDPSFLSLVESYVSVLCWINEEVVHNYVK